MKILVITQHIFPMQSPRAIRSTELIKEFALQGHQVTCYAVLGNYNYTSFLQEYPNITLKNISLKYTLKKITSDGFLEKRPLIDKVLGRLLQKHLTFPEIEFYFHSAKILQKDYQYDLLISIGAPHQIHWGCAKAKRKNPKKFPKKWLADCGDPFMNNGRANHPQYLAKFEEQFCAACDYIIVPVAHAKGGYYVPYQHKIKVIPQGFNFELNTHPQKVNHAIPHFAYSGIFYADIRNPTKFLTYLCTLKQDFVFHVYTPFTNLVLPFKKQLGKKLNIHKPLPRKALLTALKKMDFVVNLQNIDAPHRKPSKLIDYAIVQKPILSLHPEEFNPDTIQEFLAHNYQNAYIVENIQQYHIQNVVKKFLELGC